jgi:Raf kinase inhibitor-like YbhB/YbcL family protein
MELTSPAFEHNTSIPSKYTCDGENINPPLHMTNVPPKAKSLVLIVDDPDVPSDVSKKFNLINDTWDHWLIFNLPAETQNIQEGIQPLGIPGAGTTNTTTYQGPCPPDREHRYFFKLYALDNMLALPAGATKTQIEAAMEGHILEKTELIGLYQKMEKKMP